MSCAYILIKILFYTIPILPLVLFYSLMNLNILEITSKNFFY